MRNIRPGIHSVCIACFGLLAGCAVGPDYKRPEVPVPEKFKELEGWSKAMPADAAPKGDWWTGFHDDLLDRLEPMVAVSNLTVRQSYANYQQALAQVQVARSELFPTLGLTGSASRSGGPGNSASAAASSVTGRGSVVSAGSLELSAGWTLDLWGQVRRLVEENSATAQADEATLANATLSEQILLATTVIDLRASDASIALQERAVEAYRESLRVVQAQGSAGITATPPSAVISAQVALETAQATLTGMGVARAQYAHAIAVLVGKNPEELDIPRSTAMPTLPDVPIGLPSALLQRRPDIAAAERAMQAQNAAIGVAVAAYYPTISLSAAGGFSQSPLDGLLRASNRIWSIGASGTENIVDFGYRSGEVLSARAAYEASVASYRGTVLTAFESVENDLSGLRILAQEAEQLEIAVRDANRASEIALQEYQAGTVDYTTVAVALETQIGDQQTQLTVEQNRLLDAVSLIGDLGGGWSDSQLHDMHHQPASTPEKTQVGS
jgi:NodT family efflux transporter outer membrane factor (OMF) lipoprotein